jgi:two-component system chemotaxis response regulator CheB
MVWVQEKANGDVGRSIIVIGGSFGGMHALEVILSSFPKSFAIPIAIVLHRHAQSGEILTKQIQKYTELTVREPEDKEPIVPGVFVAPAGYHLLVEPGWFGLSLDPPEIYARPAIDVLFESAAHAFGQQVLGVILTGASADGARGTACIREYGGMMVAQNPATAESPRMPGAAIAVGVDLTLELTSIGPWLSGFKETLLP